MTYFKTYKEAYNDALDEAASRDEKAGKAIQPECPECGRECVWNADKKRYECVGWYDGCFLNEGAE